MTRIRSPRTPTLPRVTLWFWLGLTLALGLGCAGTSSKTVPTLTSFSPSSGLVGTTITVTGTGFSSGVTAVTLGGVNVPDGTTISDTSITFPVPSAAETGAILVTTKGGSVQSATEFIVTPAITSLSPVTGSASAGTPVTITGSGLLGIVSISFGGATATPTTHTANEIIVPVPLAAPVGTITITYQIDSSYNLDNLLSSFTVTS
jgi:hypothetical protein